MDLLSFVAIVILITASGALAPGPMFFATISQGAKTGAKAGLIFSIAHTLVEFSLIMLLTLGLLTIANKPIVKIVIGIAGGLALIIFGFIQIYTAYNTRFDMKKETLPSQRYLFFLGLIFTGLNPYFVIWWLTAGARLIILALEFAALAGVIFMFICHVWMDYVWLIGISHFAKKGTNFLGSKWYRYLMASFGGILIYFGLNFLIDALWS